MGWWRLYEHDANGNRMAGDKKDLIAAAEAGKALRVIYHGVKGDTPYKLIFEVNPVASAQGEVHGQGRWVGVDFSPGWDYLTYDNDDAIYMLNVSTTGKVNRLLRGPGGQVATELFTNRLEWICDV